MKSTVIVESPNKVSSLEKYLGPSFNVVASVGHIWELPKSGFRSFGIDVDTWTPKFRVDPSKKKVVAALRKAVAGVNKVFLATDPDREGEAIADHVIKTLRIANRSQRITFNEITKQAVLQALKHPTQINKNLVDAQTTRRMLDRIIGFQLSTLLRQKLRGSPTTPSAGRVQSVALKLVVEQEKLITTFVPVEYYLLQAKLPNNLVAHYAPKENYGAPKGVSPAEVGKIYASLKGPLKVLKVTTKERREKRYTPLKQSQLYRYAEGSLGISSARVQRAAQQLYEGFGSGGLISYPRTDSTRINPSFVAGVKSYVTKRFGTTYFQAPTLAKQGGQDAHEAVRPTDISLTPEKAATKFNLDSTTAKVYGLIYRHTLLAMMSVPVKEHHSYVLTNNKHVFTFSASTVKFDGYYAFIGVPEKPTLPPWKENDRVSVSEYTREKFFTQPPKRYTEGSLINKMDEIGVGRPSTFATTVQTIKNRHYVTKEEKSLKPTSFGFLVVERLTKHFPDIINNDYTNAIEQELDQIALGKQDYHATMDRFYKKFSTAVNTAFSTMEFEKIAPEKTGEICPESGDHLVYRHYKRTRTRFVACSAFPNCTYTRSLPKWRGKNRKPKA